MDFKKWLKIIALTIMLVLISLWVNGHLIASTTYLFIIALVPVFTQTLNSVAKAVIGKDNTSENLTDRIIAGLTKTPVMISLLAIMVLAGLFVSSVKVYANSNDSSYQILVVSDSSKINDLAQDRFTEVFHKLLFTHPFGKKYFVKVSDFQTQSVEVHPIFVTKLHIPNDFRSIPSLLARLPITNPALMKNGKFYIVRYSDTLLAVPYQQGTLAYQFGNAKAISKELIDDWEKYLEAEGVQGEMKNKLIEGWSNPLNLETDLHLHTNDSLKLYITNRQGVVKGKSSLVVRTESSIQDILLQ